MTAPQQQPGPTVGFFGAIGRYFSIISIVPGLLLAVFVFLLVQSGSWEHPPSWSRAFQKLTEVGIGGAFTLVVSAAALGLVLHPLQFALVQVLEGYWGHSILGSALRSHRIRRHVQRRTVIAKRAASLSQLIRSHDCALQRKDWQQILPENQLAQVTSAWVETQRTLAAYPRDGRHVMPTRLGNALRRAETMSGEAYGLSVVDFAPHLMMVAPDAQVQYVNDQRTALDLAVRCCLVFLLCSVVAVAFLWQWGLWLLLATVPYGLAYICYHGAVVVSREYGAALRMLMDLNRFQLYEKMHLRLPKTTASERELVANLKVLSSEPASTATVSYEHPTPSANTVPPAPNAT